MLLLFYTVFETIRDLMGLRENSNSPLHLLICLPFSLSDWSKFWRSTGFGGFESRLYNRSVDLEYAWCEEGGTSDRCEFCFACASKS